MRTKKFRAMGCQFEVTIDSHSRQADSALEKVPAWLEEWEQALSRFRADSELNHLNRSRGTPLQVSQVLWDVMQTSLQAAEQSGGLITPAVLDALEMAGYSLSFEKLEMENNIPLSTQHEAHKAAPLEEIFLDAPTRTIYLPPGMRLDFGGVAKGWAAHQTMLRLQDYGATMVNAGGDLAISGLMEGEVPWQISVIDPLTGANGPLAKNQEEKDLAVFYVGKCGVATSGRDYRRWLRNGVWKHHIIDPRSGLPAETDVMSATVIAPTVIDAEIAAKEALILGGRAGLAHVEQIPRFDGLLALQDGRILTTTGLDGKVNILRTNENEMQSNLNWSY